MRPGSLVPTRVVAVLNDWTDRRFAQRYYSRRRETWQNTRWMGTRVFKLPGDLWIYQEMLHELRPDLIVETGSAEGGSALYLGSICDLLDHGRIISVDIEAAQRPSHPRVTYITASSIETSTVAFVHEAAAECRTVLVILDSDHSRDHVLAELRTYAPLVTPGSYIVVEDTNVNGHPVFAQHGPGPWEAVEAFLDETADFEPDVSREKFMFTFNPRGYLRKQRQQTDI